MSNSGITEKAYSVLTRYFQFDNVINDGIDWKEEIRRGQNSIFRTDGHYRNTNINAQLFNLLMDAEEDIRISTMKRSGYKNIGTVMNKVCKENAKDFSLPRYLSGGYKDDLGNWYVMTPYYILKTDKEVALPDIPAGQKYADVVSLFRKQKETNRIPVDDLPDFTDLKLQIKARKAATGSSKEIIFRFPKSGICVNAKYLERIYEFMGGENVHAFTCDSEKRKTTPIILTNYNGEEAMLCTVRDYSGGVNA